MDYFEALKADREKAKHNVMLKREARKNGICLFPFPESESEVKKYYDGFSYHVEEITHPINLCLDFAIALLKYYKLTG